MQAVQNETVTAQWNDNLAISYAGITVKSLQFMCAQLRQMASPN